ncbi:hypothetical protein [Acinetobacter towneri]|uniref:hypothetical protein n=1 Tax=Acinetobacter towneri TaxID=202956 RepID=UPI001F451785|nr:hypothetical protein [Acinetobacter towneri]UIP24304.1 hypothetical protein LZG54_09050 [Acinetobacter towneri]
MKHILVPVLVVLVVLLGYLVYLEEETRKQAELNRVLTESANLSLEKTEVATPHALQVTE